MVFSSKIFLFLFFPLLYLVYYGEWKKGRQLPIKIKNIILLIASLLFYAYGEPKFVFVMAGTILVNWFGALWLDGAKEGRKRKNRLILCVLVDVGILIVFKYLTFLCDTICGIFGTENTFLQLALPIGISFYIFQILSYVFDVYYGKIPANSNLLEVALYVCMFPQLIAGPIVRYTDIIGEIRERSSNERDAAEGLYRFVMGLSKKVLLADYLSYLADTIFDGVGEYQMSSLTAWLGACAFTLQIYFDFSGYSDMAIGLGRIFGFHFNENFNYPYISGSVTEFWRRWHISLSTWFRDYVYIPLGGSRNGQAKTIRNLCIVWMLTGIWHGANWTFLFWGIWYLFWLLLEKFLFTRWTGKKFIILNHVYALLVIVVGWVIFKADSLGAAWLLLKNMFVGGGKGLIDSLSVEYLRIYGLIFPVGILCSMPLAKWLKHKWALNDTVQSILKSGVMLLLFGLSCLAIIKQEYSPFIYFIF